MNQDESVQPPSARQNIARATSPIRQRGDVLDVRQNIVRATSPIRQGRDALGQTGDDLAMRQNIVRVVSPIRQREDDLAVGQNIVRAVSPIRQREDDLAVRQSSFNDTSVLLKKISSNVSVRRGKDAEIFVRYSIDRDNRDIQERCVAGTLREIRHPNIVMILKSIKRSNSTMDVDVEYCDAKSVERLVPLLGQSNSRERMIVSHSVGIQVASGLFFHQMFFGVPHRNVVPRNCLMRGDGTVKLTMFDVLTKRFVGLNQKYLIDSPYCPPESATSSEARSLSTSAGDVWSLGVLLLSIITGFKLHYVEPMRYSETDSEPSSIDMESLQVFRRLIYGQDDDLWRQMVRDDVMREIIRNCLAIRPKNRFGIDQVYALLIMNYGLDFVIPFTLPDKFADINGSEIRELLSKYEEEENPVQYRGEEMINPNRPTIPLPITYRVLPKLSQLLFTEHNEWKKHCNNDKEDEEERKNEKKAWTKGLREIIKKQESTHMSMLKEIIRPLLEQIKASSV